MKDHEIRGVVNELVEVANRYANHQCLRVCLANVIVPILKGRLPRPQTNREAFESYLKQNYNGLGTYNLKQTAEGKYLGQVYKKTDALEIARVQHLWEVWNHGRI